MDQSKISFSIQDVEPGWTCVSFIKPPRLAKSRTHALITFLESWRQNHPTRRVEQIEFVEDGQIVRGLNIFWSVFEHSESESILNEFKVDEELENMYGLEYAEALMHDALASGRCEQCQRLRQDTYDFQAAHCDHHLEAEENCFSYDIRQIHFRDGRRIR